MDTRRERRPFSRRHLAALRIPVIQVDSVLPNSHFHSSVASVCVSWTHKTTNCVPKVPPFPMRMRSSTCWVSITPLDAGPSKPEKFPSAIHGRSKQALTARWVKMGQNRQQQRLGRIFIDAVCIFFLPVWYRTSCRDDQNLQQATTL
jgi:hypothetical protein